MITLRGVSKVYDKEKALHEISLTAQEGCVTVLLGVEDSGKSVLCDIICGVCEPDSGSVVIDGCEMEKDPIEAKRHIGYMPQDPSVFRDMTPRGQLKFIGQAHEMSARALNERVEKVLKQTQLTEAANKPIRLLPEAYLQRIGLAQAIMGNVNNIVLDAPSKPLDAKQVVELRSILKEVLPGRTVILSTANLTEAAAFGGMVYLMDGGRIIGKCDVKELAGLQADGDKTVVKIAGEAEAVKKALGSMKTSEVSEEDGLTVACVETGAGIEGKKQLFAALSAAGLAVVDMRPAKRDLSDIFLKLENEPFAAEGAEAE